MRFKDFIALGLLALASFPVILLGVLLWTGNVRLAFGPEGSTPGLERERLQTRPEDMHGIGPNLPTPNHMDGALGLREAELDRREAEVQREMAHLGDLRAQDERLRDTIVSERKRIEALLGSRDSLENKRLLVLGQTFTAMKAKQAAEILVSMDDVLVTGVLRAIKDDKPRGKILAEIGKLDTKRAATIARLLRTVGKPLESTGGKS